MKTAEQLAYETVCDKYNDVVFLLEELQGDLDVLIEKASSIKEEHTSRTSSDIQRVLSYYKEEIELLAANQ